MLLNDRKIKEYISKGKIVIDPYDENFVGPASVDVRLGFRFRIFKNVEIEAIDPREYHEKVYYTTENERYRIEHGRYSNLYIIKDPSYPFVLHPGEFVLASVYEYLKLPSDIAAQLQGRSSFARLGLIIHTSAGWVDPGYEGHLTLEIVNVNKIPIKLYPLTKIGQLSFFEMEPAEVPYNKRKSSKYVGEAGATNSLIARDYQNQ